MLAAEPPGHGTNQMSAVEDFEQLVSLYKQELNLHPDRPFVLFGHSMGGMVAFRLAQKLEREGIYPQAVIISAIQPPHVERKKCLILMMKNFSPILSSLAECRRS